MASRSSSYSVNPTVAEYYSNGNPPYTRVVNIVTRMFSRTWDRTPNYKTLRRLGQELPVNSMEESILEKDTKASWHSHQNWYSGYPAYTLTEYDYCGGFVPPIVTLPEVAHASLYNKALAKLPTRVNGGQFSAPVFLAELRKTTSMITTLATQLSQALPPKEARAFKRRKAWQNAWLEYRYGWRLLVKDIYDLLVAVHDTRTRRPVLRVAAEATQVDADSFIVDAASVTDTLRANSLFWNDLKVNRSVSRGCRITVRFRDQTPLLGTLQQYGITNPMSVAWELVPYSFVIDWLVPVGDYLRTLDTWVGKEFVSGSVSYWTDNEAKSVPISFRCSQPSQWWWVTSSTRPGETRIRRRQFKRIPLSSFPVASLPRIEVNLNASRTVDAIALLKQTFDRRVGSARMR